MSMSLRSEGGEYAIEAYAVELGPEGSFGGVLVVRRMPGLEVLFRDVCAERGCCYRSAREAVRSALLEGHRFIRARERRCVRLC